MKNKNAEKCFNIQNALLSSAKEEIRIFKVRLIGRDDYDKDFIEMDVPVIGLTFRSLIEAICEEFSIDPSIIIKIRKLPNTKIRRDVEVQRMVDYQELEVETLNSS